MAIFAVANALLYPLFHLGLAGVVLLLAHPIPLKMALATVSEPTGVGFLRRVYHRLVDLLVPGHDSRPGGHSRPRAGSAGTDRVRHPGTWLSGPARHWQRYEQAYYLLAALATPLVVSVHSVVSSDSPQSASSRAWHSTIFPPYFVAGAIYSGFAMGPTIAIPLRKAYHLDDFVTERHLDTIAKVMLVTGLIVAYSYIIEIFDQRVQRQPARMFLVVNRAFGPYGGLFWLLLCAT